MITVARSAAPTRWPARPSVSPAAAFGAVTGGLTFNNANTTAFTDPAIIQQAIAGIACAVRVPLENIVIQNVTQIRPNGTVVALPFIQQTLNSSGVPVCFYVPRRNATGRLLRAREARRALQATDAVKLDYTIIDPAPELLTTDSVEFVSTVEADPAIAELSLALGASAVSAAAPPELALAVGNTVAPSTPTPADTNVIPYVVGGLVAAFVVGAVGMAAVAFVIVNRKPAPTFQKPSKSSVVVIQESGPITNPMAGPVLLSGNRQRFEPQSVRGAGTRV